MSPIHAIILGLVEGITEYLPVSSTGHLILAAALLGLHGPEQKAAVDAFSIIVQGGAILAVLGLYRARVLQMIRGVLGRDPAGLRLAINLVVAFIPAAGLGVLLDDIIEANLFYPGPVIGALVLGGLYMMVLDQWRQGRFSVPRARGAEIEIDDLTPSKAFLIGLMQCVAMWPGTSRSMMTITGGMVVGLRPAAAAEFSFLLGLPTLGAACVYKLVKDFAAAGEVGPGGEIRQTMLAQLGGVPVILGLLTATVSAAIAVRWLVRFLNTHGLTPFGWYRILLGAVLLGLIVGGTLQWGAVRG